MLFDNNDVLWEDRDKYKNDPKAQFKRKYLQLFKEVVKSYEETKRPFMNNFYVDKNRKKFGLVEKNTITKKKIIV